MKSINTLVQDIYDLVQRKDGWFDEELSKSLAESIAARLSAQLGEQKNAPTLRLSKMGPSCPKALWHSIHTPELAEPLPPWAEIKYSYGHVIEALAIAFAKASGHLVTGEQDELVLDGIKGHRDCVIDGCIVDVKSTSSIQFDKFKDKSIGLVDGQGVAYNDTFGYLDQLDGYLGASLSDPLVLVKDTAYILAIDKQLGRICLYEHRFRPLQIISRIRDHKNTVALPAPPTCSCGTVPEGKSGNIRLDTKASYSAYKHCCFPHLRVFRYSSGLKYLTHIERLPDVPEIYGSKDIPKFTGVDNH